MAESLKLAQVADPVETIILVDKWDKDSSGTPITDSFIEPFNGDFGTDPANPTRSLVAANRHQERINCTFFDGHAKAMLPAMIQQSADLTGCRLAHLYPFPGLANADSTGVCAAVTSQY
jgi:prepilin-type processing-associated H-X9-DG protein